MSPATELIFLLCLPPRPNENSKCKDPILDHPVGSCEHAGGIVTLICFAVFRLITSSNFVGYSTGKSAGLAPLRFGPS